MINPFKVLLKGLKFLSRGSVDRAVERIIRGRVERELTMGLTFLKALAAAAIGGISTAVGAYLSTGGDITSGAILGVIISGALVGVVAYLKQSPIAK